MYRESLSHLQRVSSMNVSLVCKVIDRVGSSQPSSLPLSLSLSPLVFRLLYTHTHIYRRGVWYILLIAWCVHHFFIWSGSVLSALYTASSTLSLCVCIRKERAPILFAQEKSLSSPLHTRQHPDCCEKISDEYKDDEAQQLPSFCLDDVHIRANPSPPSSAMLFSQNSQLIAVEKKTKKQNTKLKNCGAHPAQQ